MRIVADTNTVISGLLWQGPPRRLVDAGRTQEITLITSGALLAELAEVLAREKFAVRLRRAGVSARTLIEDYARIAQVVVPVAMDRTVTSDPDDEEVIACALAGGADVIVTGDSDLLDLGSYEGIPIQTPRAWLDSDLDPRA